MKKEPSCQKDPWFAFHQGHLKNIEDSMKTEADFIIKQSMYCMLIHIAMFINNLSPPSFYFFHIPPFLELYFEKSILIIVSFAHKDHLNIWGIHFYHDITPEYDVISSLSPP